MFATSDRAVNQGTRGHLRQSQRDVRAEPDQLAGCEAENLASKRAFAGQGPEKAGSDRART